MESSVLSIAMSVARSTSATLPVARLEVVAAVTLIPVLRYPMRAAALAHEMTVNPYVVMTIPSIIPRSPNESGTRRRYFDHTRCRRRDVDVDADGRECWRHGANEHCCRQGGQNQPAAL
jgi:hypothetical protein